jgi:hypothetical protein
MEIVCLQNGLKIYNFITCLNDSGRWFWKKKRFSLEPEDEYIDYMFIAQKKDIKHTNVYSIVCLWIELKNFN